MDLFTKAKDLGIQTEFIDGQGHRHVTDAAALKIILNALPPQTPRPLAGPAGGGPVRAAGAERTRPAASIPGATGKSLPDAEGYRGGRDRPIASSTGPTDLPIGVYRLQLTDAASVDAKKCR